MNNIKINKKIKYILVFAFLFLAIFALAKFGLAQESNLDTGLNYAAETGLSAEDPRIIIARIIRIFMGFLGIIAVCLIMYAGWLWMTAGGNSESVDTAKKLLLGAVIGLIIILSAFAIASFILSKLLEATSGTSETDNGGGGGGSGGGGGGGAGLISCDSNPFTSKCEADVLRCQKNQYCANDCYCRDKGDWGASCDSVASTTACEADDNMCMEYLDCKSDQGCRCFGPPVIKWVSPMDQNSVPNGAPGNFVTIGGLYFGTTTGKVYFSDSSGEPNVLAPFPDTVNAKCNKNWKDNQIIVIVPAGAKNGPIKVVRADNENDTTNNTRGPNIKDFSVNALHRPGVCLLDPDKGYYNSNFAVQGTGFNGTSRTVSFGNGVSSTTANEINGWTNNEVKAKIPNIKAGETPTLVNIDGIESNYLIMSVLYDLSANPSIDYIDPPDGPIGQYITIYGKNFQAYKFGVSLVEFYNPITKATSSADGLDLALECRSNWWHDTYITVKVPKVDQLGKDYIVTVTNKDGRTSAPAPENFTVRVGDPGPGLCLLNPHNGPVSYLVKAYGDKFGATQGNGKAVFFNNVNGDINSWGVQKVETRVPSGAITGPFSIFDNASTKSNSLPFMVGKCVDAAKDCNSGEVCCLGGTYWDGICRQPESGETEEISCNKGKPDLGAYGWTFSTTPPQPDTCAGYTNAKACADAGMCPNSPGQCQTSASSTIGTGCSADFCDYNYPKSLYNKISVYATYASSTYDSVLNRCKIGNSSCNATSSVIISGKIAECRVVKNQAVWQYNPGGESCMAANSFLDLNGWCTAGTLTVPRTCSLCPAGFACFNSMCASINSICPSNSSCVNSKCISNNSTCDCCCRVGYDAQDCCSGLKCTAGNCGAGAPKYGLCTGCKRDLNNDGQVTTPAEIAASDGACNCVAGKNNRYCSLTETGYLDGVCRDNKRCDANPNNATCDPNNNACSQNEYCNPSSCNCEKAVACDSDIAQTGCQVSDNMCNGLGASYIKYCDIAKNCTCQPKYCNSTPNQIDIDGALVCTASSTMCAAVTEYCDTNQCICRPNGLPLGAACYSTTTQMCDLTCANPYNCLGKSGENKTGPICSDKSCTCCCDPNANPPVKNAYGLSCYKDKTPCDGDKRGLFCGCINDEQCDGGALNGCGLDTCCRPRPFVESTEPIDMQNKVCRNAVLSATFDHLMSPVSFTGEVVVVGDYGSAYCPTGTQYLTKQSEPKTKLATLVEKISLFIKKIINPLLNVVRAYTPPQFTHNYCAVTGKVTASNSPDGKKTTLEFSPSRLYDASTTYYVIIKGDSNTTDKLDEGVLDYYGISMNRVSNEAFNKINYTNSYIWQFTTLSDQTENKGVCVIDHISMTPSSYLFNTITNDLDEDDESAYGKGFDTAYDKDKVFKADAISKGNQKIAPVSGYNWEWVWSIDNFDIVRLIASTTDLPTNQKLVEAVPGKTDGKTFVNANAKITEDTLNTGVSTLRGSASVWLFICENPWPTVSGGLWSPWQDKDKNCTSGLDVGLCNSTGYEIYYCRDREKVGTADDMPAILSDDTIIRSSSTAQNLLKEFYFFREAPAIQPLSNNFIVSDVGDGSTALVSWPAINGVAGYKLYYGTKSHNYSYYISATSTQSVISGLTNKTKYYFAYTSFNNRMVESGYSEEISVIPTDITPPNMPQNVVATTSNGAIEVSWNLNTDDAVGYKIYYGTVSGVYGQSSAIIKTTKYIIKNLTYDKSYYIAVRAVDINKNESVGTEVVTKLIIK